MKRRIVIIILICVSSLIIYAQEKNKEIFPEISTQDIMQETIDIQEMQNKLHDDRRTLIYLHPFSFIPAAIGLLNHSGEPVILLYSTVAVPISLSNSLVVRPSLWNNTKTTDGDGTFRVGSDIGFRYYYYGKFNSTTLTFARLYLQAQAGVFYYSTMNSWAGDDIPDGKKENYIWLDVMGYLGCSFENFYGLRTFVDIGIGRRNNKDYVFTFNNSSFIFDINIGFGFPIGKRKN